MKMTVSNFSSVKEQFLLDVQTAVEMEDIPPELVFNWDQMGVSIVPGSTWTMELKGVEITGISDKRQITAVVAQWLENSYLLSSYTKARQLPVSHDSDFPVTGM